MAGTNNGAFMQGLTSATVKVGGAKIDTQGYNISIAQVVQRQYAPDAGVPIVFISHSAQMQNVTAALETIKKFSFVLDPPVHYRII